MTIKLTIPGMACSACASNITKAVIAIDANAIVEADTKTKFVNVETQASESVIREALIAAGYPPS
ncbi:MULTISPECIES: heavy-metal-associated domain-containing protein [Nostocales]|jgi:copper chaperone|uniref:Heavy metal transport/detoxification protein n=3 Tax=Aphanizomenonaceae TaxID=1892259 RepID=A0A1Z4V6M7_9CYAN|nr:MULTISPECIES: heavy-metal-associated domain-containing protein [Nostocales]MBO1071913.1 heavy-metal-associated domain-containing protein [Dolichospermum sp. DEX189]QSV69933.1 MAG: heavy-metal-associated domain-containing protein [Aphanizomenon flos-aquae KM1D3_PB]KHG40768.1 heavy metal transporter [Aphanizomenon flos-aquae 2012/KM1/D3]MBD2280776.1 heavy-metal-associated domain-containing protein [Aphanizomenon flos-aquae FACHB-1040]MBE9256505.1 heavy-metal-associated domain-containing prote